MRGTASDFWAAIDKRGPDECWPWTGPVDGCGYGRFRFEGKQYGAHELALVLHLGMARPPGLETCHNQECETPACCNPHHLRFDTHLSNMKDRTVAGRSGPQIRIEDEIVRMIRIRRAEGVRTTVLTREFGVSQGFVSNVTTGKSRLDAGGPVVDTNRKAMA